MKRIFQYLFPNGVLPHNDLGRKWIRYLCRTMAWLPVDQRHSAISKHAPWMSEAERCRLMAFGPYWYTMTSLGQKLEVDLAMYTELRTWSVLPVDAFWEDLQVLKKERHRVREERRRRRKGAKAHADSATRTKPWIAAGFKCRRTWERHGTSGHYLHLQGRDLGCGTVRRSTTSSASD